MVGDRPHLSEIQLDAACDSSDLTPANWTFLARVLAAESSRLGGATDDEGLKIFPEGAHSQAVAVADICRRAGVRKATYFNWKRKYHRLLPTEMRRLKQLELVRSHLWCGVVADCFLTAAIARSEQAPPVRRPTILSQTRHCTAAQCLGPRTTAAGSLICLVGKGRDQFKGSMGPQRQAFLLHTLS